MSSSAPSVTQGGPSPATAFTSVLNTAVGTAATLLERKVGTWTDKLNDLAAHAGSADRLSALADEGLDELAEDGGAKAKAGAQGLKAGLHGRNALWAAIKGAWQSGTPAVQAAIVTGAVSAALLLLVSPVLLCVFLLSLLIIAAVRRARTSSR